MDQFILNFVFKSVATCLNHSSDVPSLVVIDVDYYPSVCLSLLSISSDGCADVINGRHYYSSF
jgi:hypothetical protein